MNTTHNPIALNLPTVVALLIIYARHVAQSLNGNTWVTTTTPPLATFNADIDALEVAEAAARSRTKGAAAARDIKKKVVVDDLTSIKGNVLSAANLNPAQADAIIESAGMTPKRFGRKPKAELAALMGPTPGEVLVRAKAVAKGAAYEWQYSPDGGKTWIAMGTTTVANTSVFGLVAGSSYMFRFRATVKKTTSDWTQTITFFVH
jgi:hypothetical protein